jgi:signal peptidase I
MPDGTIDNRDERLDANEAPRDADAPSPEPRDEPDTAGPDYGPDPFVVASLERERREQEAQARRQRRADASQRRLKFMLPLLIVLTFIVYAYTTNYIPSESMLPTLKPGDHILTTRSWLAYPRGAMPRIGDIVVFKQPAALDSPADATDPGNRPKLFLFRDESKPLLIKRVVALPGQWIQKYGNDLYLNGVAQHPNYGTIPDAQWPDLSAMYAVHKPYQVPPGMVFVMGDNRANSEDSRYFGPIKRSDIIGRFTRVLWNEGETGPNEQRALRSQQ